MPCHSLIPRLYSICSPLTPLKERPQETGTGIWYYHRPNRSECVLARASGTGCGTGIEVGQARCFRIRLTNSKLLCVRGLDSSMPILAHTKLKCVLSTLPETHACKHARLEV